MPRRTTPAPREAPELPDHVRAGYGPLPRTPATPVETPLDALTPIPELERWEQRQQGRRQWCGICRVAILTSAFADHQRLVHPRLR